jgi:hypothetical protein
MENIFIHDAIPTWSGFIYQGEIAAYLAVKKICELRDQENMTLNEIGSKYFIEVENCEDISIVKVDNNSKCCISIHQVKNQKDNIIGAYHSPLVQLMLEKGFHTKEKLGDPQAFLHVSNAIHENYEGEVINNLEKWYKEIKEFYINLKDLIVRVGIDDEKVILDEVTKTVNEEPIKLNRSEYKNGLIKKISDICKNDTRDIDELKQELQKLIDFLEQRLGVNFISKNVQLYQYDNGKIFCSVNALFFEIVEQVKKFKNHDSAITSEQFEFITDKLLHKMREHVLERHKAIQTGVNFEKSIAFNDIIHILNDDLLNYEKSANILALRRLYDEYLIQYCVLQCEKECLIEDGKYNECKLKVNEFRRVNLCDEEFIKLCYGLNPECHNTISERTCIGSLLNADGLTESVFEIIKKVPEELFIEKDDMTKFVIDNRKNNAFLTAISSRNSSIVVQNIVKGIDSNAELVSPIFDADQLITTRLEDDASVWGYCYSEIQEKYIKEEMITRKEMGNNNICMPKTPQFIKADDVLKNI